MKKVLFAALALTLLAAPQAFGEGEANQTSLSEGYEEVDATTFFPVRFTPCNSWRYDSDLGGYYCSFTDLRVEVPEMRDFQSLERLVDSLERRITALESRINDLEAAK